MCYRFFNLYLTCHASNNTYLLGQTESLNWPKTALDSLWGFFCVVFLLLVDFREDSKVFLNVESECLILRHFWLKQIEAVRNSTSIINILLALPLVQDSVWSPLHCVFSCNPEWCPEFLCKDSAFQKTSKHRCVKPQCTKILVFLANLLKTQ